MAALGRNRLFRWALGTLALIYSLAIYAPLVANDRPYVIEAIDYGSYERNLRTLYPVSLSVERLLRLGAEDYLLEQPAGSPLGWHGALASEVEAVRLRAGALREMLGTAETASLDRFQQRIEEAVAAGRSGASARPALEIVAEAKLLAKELREEYRAQNPVSSGASAEGGRPLLPATRYPLFEALSAFEMFCMLLWGFFLTWGLWSPRFNRHILGGDRLRIRRARVFKLSSVCLMSALLALLWGGAMSRPEAFDKSNYKEDLTRGGLVASRVWFPPLAFGFAESHGGEIYHPPSWAPASGTPGFTGPRADAPGPTPTVTSVEWRFGEPATDAFWRHPLGTDSIGRDILVRMLIGGRVSLSVGLISALLLLVLGIAIGACAGYFGGRIDLVLSRLMEVVLCFPAFFLILMVVAFTDPAVVPPIFLIVIVIAAVRWTGVARLTRAEFLRLREEEFALAARATGIGVVRTIVRHLLPNALGPILVAGAFAVASGILTESALSFLGFGVAEPIPSWGSLVSDSRSAEHWWIQVFPGLAIFLTVVCYNLVGEGIRDAIDPKMRV